MVFYVHREIGKSHSYSHLLNDVRGAAVASERGENDEPGTVASRRMAYFCDIAACISLSVTSLATIEFAQLAEDEDADDAQRESHVGHITCPEIEWVEATQHL